MPARIEPWLAIFFAPAVLIFLGIILYRLISELLRLSREREVPTFESNWGGLGRGLGGWNVNRMMVVALLTLLFLAIFGGFALELLWKERASQSSSERSNSRLSTNEHSSEGSPSKASAGSSSNGHEDGLPGGNYEILNCQSAEPVSDAKVKGRGGRSSATRCAETPAAPDKVSHAATPAIGKH